MAGRSDRHRDVSSLYQTRRTADAALGEGPSDRRRRSSRRRRQPPSPPTTQREEDEEEARSEDDDELVRHTDKEEGAHEEDGTGSASSGSSTVYLRGLASLPPVLLPHQRPMIRPEGQK